MELVAGDYRCVLAPAIGGSVALFDWQAKALFRAAKPDAGSVLDMACFPLVPFANRIAEGRFSTGDETIRLSANFPGHDHPHPIHGFGWLHAWSVEYASESFARLAHVHVAGEWPWSYRAEQEFSLSPTGLVHRIRVRNRSEKPMPTGLGYHPYIPRDDQTRYIGFHSGAWRTNDDGLPEALTMSAEPRDWWEGKPVASRCVDTVFTGRHGNLRIEQPSLKLTLVISPSCNLTHTAVYNPPSADFLCVEPATHSTDAINRHDALGMFWLKKDEELEAHVEYRVEPHQIVPL